MTNLNSFPVFPFDITTIFWCKHNKIPIVMKRIFEYSRFENHKLMMLVRRSVAQFRPLVTDREGGEGRG